MSQNSFYLTFPPKKPKTEKRNRTEKSHNYKITKLQIFEIAKLQNCKIAKLQNYKITIPPSLNLVSSKHR